MIPQTFNFNFTEKRLGEKQVRVTNTTGHALVYGELVYLDGYFGEVREFGGIAIGASGMINIDHERNISTGQVRAADTFVVGRMLYFLPGLLLVAGSIIATPDEGSIPVGPCLEEQGVGGAQTAVTFRPPVQRTEYGLGRVLKTVEVIIDADATAGQAFDIPIGSKIVDMHAIATAANAGGTVKLQTNGAVPADIGTAIAMAADGAVSRLAAGFDDTLRIVGTDGVRLITNGAADRGLVYVSYI